MSSILIKLDVLWKEVGKSMRECGRVPDLVKGSSGISSEELYSMMQYVDIDLNTQPLKNENQFNNKYYQQVFASLYTLAAKKIGLSPVNAEVFGQSMSKIITNHSCSHHYIQDDIDLAIATYTFDNVLHSPQPDYEKSFFESKDVQSRVFRMFDMLDE